MIRRWWRLTWAVRIRSVGTARPLLDPKLGRRYDYETVYEIAQPPRLPYGPAESQNTRFFQTAMGASAWFSV